jgi:hypothetical protein
MVLPLRLGDGHCAEICLTVARREGEGRVVRRAPTNANTAHLCMSGCWLRSLGSLRTQRRSDRGRIGVCGSSADAANAADHAGQIATPRACWAKRASASRPFLQAEAGRRASAAIAAPGCLCQGDQPPATARCKRAIASGNPRTFKIRPVTSRSSESTGALS